MKYVVIAFTLLLFFTPTKAQQFLGTKRPFILAAKSSCTPMDNYPEMLVLSCSGMQSIFYFNGPDSTCDLYAIEMEQEYIGDTMQNLLKTGFSDMGVKYMESFLVSKHPNHNQFPSLIYSNGKIQYCFMPISLNGKITSLNSMIVTYVEGPKRKN